MKAATKILLVLTCIFFISKGLSAQNIIFDKTYDTESNKKLNYSIVSGDINVQTWEKNQVKINIKGDDKLKDMLEISEGNSSGNISVTVKLPDKNLNNDKKMSTDIYVPSTYNVDIKTAGGDLSVNGIIGNIDLKTAGGEIKINGTKGGLDIKTAGGDISIKNHKGNIDANTAGGDINILSSDGEIKLSTMGGDINVLYSGENKGIKLSTMSGDIDLKIPSDTKADLKLNTLGGDIKVDFDLTGKKKNDNSLSGKINGGGESIKCNTMSGNITIH
jgi:DUF4097 and DUF4098 domain-containing protein YvlB